MHVPEASYRPAAYAILALLLLSSSMPLASGQDSGAFGLGAQGLGALIKGKDIAPVLAMDEAALGDTGDFGASAYYYLARWLDSRDPASAAASEKARLLYRKAYERAPGLARRESGLYLMDRLGSAALWEELLSFTAEFAASAGTEWRVERARLEALDALARDAEAIAHLDRLKLAYPAEAEKDAEALSYFAMAASLRSRGSKWNVALRSLLLERPASEWTERAYRLATADPKALAVFTLDEQHALSMRDAVRRKEYGLAYKEANLGPEAAMGRGASQAMIADAGKAFLYSGALKDGTRRFTAVGWTASFYKARFAKALERWREAEELFLAIVRDAPTKADADAARWYAADCAYRGALAAAGKLESIAARKAAEAAARKAALESLVAASAAWSDAAAFSDLTSGLFRDALRSRDWRLVEAMADRLAPRLGSEMGARIAYVAARSLELGLGAGSRPEGSDPERRAADALARFAAIAANAAAPLHYRALAAWRSGAEPSFAPEATSAAAPPGAAPDETESFIQGIAAFGLYDIAVAEARSRKARLSDDALRRLADSLALRGRPDGALRLALELTTRAGYEPRRADFELLYPRPYLEEIRSLGLGSRMSESVALGLLRSESIFRADALSPAGAVGLSQLMPATAAEQARALGMKGYDLNSPKDNLAIGLAHFASLLARTDGHPLRAMMAYNAGWGRLRTWAAESGELPDDLMVEALGIEETRQYCRNIIQATVMYGQLYYGRRVAESVGELVGGVKVDSEMGRKP